MAPINLLETAPISRTRRNHALEHATLNVLAQHFPHLRLAGVSDAGGFWIIGPVELDSLTSAAVEALTRLRNGEKQLAYHPGCGTGYATTGILAGFLAWIGMLPGKPGLRRSVERLPAVIILAMLGAVIAQPLGSKAQTHLTTQAVPGSLALISITAHERGQVTAYRVRTRG